MDRIVPIPALPRQRRVWLAYAASLAGIGAAFWLTLLVPPLLHGAAFLLPLAAVAGSASLAGLGPAVTSGIVAVFGYIYMLPGFGSNSGSAVALVVFVAVASLVIVLSDSGRRAAAMAREQRRWLKVTIASIGDAVIATDNSGVVALMNAVAEELTGWRREEAIGTPLCEVFRIIDEETRVRLESPAERVMRHSIPVVVDGRKILVARTGREIPIDDCAAPIRDDDGAMQGVILVFRDISQRRRNERDLHESEKRLRLSQEAGEMATWEWNLRTGAVTWSGRLDGLRGTAAGLPEDPGSFLERIHPEDRSRVSGIIGRVAQERIPFQMEFRVVRPDGSVRWLSAKGQVFPDQNGRRDRVIGVATDVTARKQAEDALRASEERFYKAFNLSPLPKWISRFETGEMVDVNEAFLRSTGFKREEVLDRVPGQFGLWDAGEDRRLAEIVRSRIRGRDLKFRFRRKSGQNRVFLLSFERITLDREPCLLAVANDITERKQAEEALRESEERFRLMADTAPVMIWLSGPDRSRTYFNRGWLDFTGRALGAQLGDGWAAVVHPDDLEGCLSRYSDAFESRGDFQMEYRLMRADGQYRWILDVGVPRFTADGTFAGYIGSCLDISERRRAEEEREQLLASAEAARRRAALAAEVSTILASSLEYDTSLQAVAQLAVDHFADWCTIDVVEDGGARRVALARREGNHQAQAALVAEHKPVLVMNSGRPDFVPVVSREWALSVAEDPADGDDLLEIRLTSSICVPIVARGQVLDMTLVTAAPGRRYAEEDFALAQDLANRIGMALESVRYLVEAQEANRTKDEFLATVSHELRTPLNSILGWAKMLGTGRLDKANATRAIEIIERNAKAQAQLIEDLLDISRIISGKLRLDLRSVDLVQIVEAAVDAVRIAAESKGIRIQRVLDSGVGLISGDPDRLQQVVWNLLSNAIKFTPRDGRVQVCLEKSDSNAMIVVSDTGAGITPEFLPHVFERFRQVDSSSTRKHGGLGLGLAIVSQLVELHGGVIRVESSGAGRGSTFTVSLPVDEASAVREEAQPREAAAATWGTGSPVLQSIRVLLVEDEQDARDVLAFILRQYGAEVTAVESAAEAFEALGSGVHDVLISDIEMPVEDGYGLIRRVRAREAQRGGHGVPAAALTAYARSEDRMRALSAGFQVHVPKPIEPAELVAVVAGLSGRTSLVQAR